MKGTKEQQLTARIEKAKALLKGLIGQRKRLRLKASAANRKKVLDAMRLNQNAVLDAVRKANPELFKKLAESAVQAARVGGKRKRR